MPQDEVNTNQNKVIGQHENDHSCASSLATVCTKRFMIFIIVHCGNVSGYTYYIVKS